MHGLRRSYHWPCCGWCCGHASTRGKTKLLWCLCFTFRRNKQNWQHMHWDSFTISTVSEMLSAPSAKKEQCRILCSTPNCHWNQCTTCQMKSWISTPWWPVLVSIKFHSSSSSRSRRTRRYWRRFYPVHLPKGVTFFLRVQPVMSRLVCLKRLLPMRTPRLNWTRNGALATTRRQRHTFRTVNSSRQSSTTIRRTRSAPISKSSASVFKRRKTQSHRRSLFASRSRQILTLMNASRIQSRSRTRSSIHGHLTSRAVCAVAAVAIHVVVVTSATTKSCASVHVPLAAVTTFIATIWYTNQTNKCTSTSINCSRMIMAHTQHKHQLASLCRAHQ